MKIWIHTTRGDKTIISVTAEINGNLTADTLLASLRDTLLPIDVPSPNVLAAHATHLDKFNIARFKPADFVEYVDFDCMTVELLREKRPHKRNPLDEV